MHGVLVGGIFGMAFISFMGAWRSVTNWRNSTDRPSKARLIIQVTGQVGLGITATAFGLWYLWFGQ